MMNVIVACPYRGLNSLTPSLNEKLIASIIKKIKIGRLISYDF